MNELTEAQQACLEAILIAHPNGIDAIGTPQREDDIVKVRFQDGWMSLEATIYLNKTKNNIETRLLNPDDEPENRALEEKE